MRDSAGVKPPWCTNPPPAPCTPGCEASEYTHRTVAAASISPNTRRVYLQKSPIKGGKEAYYRAKIKRPSSSLKICMVMRSLCLRATPWTPLSRIISNKLSLPLCLVTHTHTHTPRAPPVAQGPVMKHRC